MDSRSREPLALRSGNLLLSNMAFFLFQSPIELETQIASDAFNVIQSFRIRQSASFLGSPVLNIG